MAAQCLGWTLAAACFMLLLGLQLRRDLVPDYLSLCKDKFFERDGFCFGVSLDREDALAMFTIMFQSRYLGPSIARIALRPAGAGVASVSPDIECGPAGFGVAKFPVAIPRRHQGKTVTFEIGVDADYPLGKGREVRFRNGRTIRHNSRFRSLTVVVAGDSAFARRAFSRRIRPPHPLDAASRMSRNIFRTARSANRKCSGACRRTNRCDTRWNGNRTHHAPP